MSSPSQRSTPTGSTTKTAGPATSTRVRAGSTASSPRLLLVDPAGSALKGATHFRALGPLYPARQLLLAAACVAAACLRHRRLHLGFALLALALEFWRAADEFGIAPEG
jgi:hypothetical protein